MNDKRRLVVHGVTAEAWAARWGIEIFSHPCFRCGRTCTVSIPFAQGSLRGLQAPPCECGNERTPYGIVRDPVAGDLFDIPADERRSTHDPHQSQGAKEKP